MTRRPPRSTLSSSSAASDVYKRQTCGTPPDPRLGQPRQQPPYHLSLIHISEPTRLLSISYAVFCLKKKKNQQHKKNNHTRYNNKNKNHHINQRNHQQP